MRNVFGTRAPIHFMVITAIICLLFTVPSPAQAAESSLANTYDWNFEFRFDWGETQGTPTRKKDGSTSVYVRLDAVTIPKAELFVDGSNREDPESSFKNMMAGTHVYIAEGMHGQFSIHNRVYETYGRDSWARLTGLRKTGTGIARGAWSPDSTRLYTELNPPV